MVSADDRPDDPDMIARIAAGSLFGFRAPLNRLERAIRRLLSDRPAARFRALIALMIVAVFAFTAAALTGSPLVWIPVAVLIAAAVALQFAPDDHENGDGS